MYSFGTLGKSETVIFNSIIEISHSCDSKRYFLIIYLELDELLGPFKPKSFHDSIKQV